MSLHDKPNHRYGYGSAVQLTSFGTFEKYGCGSWSPFALLSFLGGIIENCSSHSCEPCPISFRFAFSFLLITGAHPNSSICFWSIHFLYKNIGTMTLQTNQNCYSLNKISGMCATIVHSLCNEKWQTSKHEDL